MERRYAKDSAKIVVENFGLKQSNDKNNSGEDDRGTKTSYN